MKGRFLFIGRPFRWSPQASPQLQTDAGYTLQHAVDDLIGHGCLDCAPDTVAFYRGKAGHLLRLFGGELPLSEFTMGRSRGYIRTRQEEGAIHNTILKELITLRRVLKLAHDDGLLKSNARDLVPRFRVRYQPRERWLTPQELGLLLGQLRR